MNPRLFLSGYGSLHTHPANSTANPDIFKSTLQSGKKYILNESDNGESRVNPDIFESDDVANSCPVSYRTINQYGGATATTEPFSFPEAAILLVSDGDRDLWPSQRSNDWALA